MKLNLKKKKAKQPSIIQQLEQKADKLAKLYQKWHVVASNAENQKKEANALIKQLAATSGTMIGKETVVEGKEFVVGFSTITSTVIDSAAAKDLLPKELYDTLTVSALDATKFERAVDEGKIDRAIVAKILKDGPSQQRVLIRAVKSAPTE